VASRFPCPYLRGEVELTDERESHIAATHPDLLPGHRTEVAATLAEPDEVHRSARSATTRLFVRWYDTLRGGKHVVVVVVTDAGLADRHWIVTAYIARRLVAGGVEWKRS
jgi:hypothetical protein